MDKLIADSTLPLVINSAGGESTGVRYSHPNDLIELMAVKLVDDCMLPCFVDLTFLCLTSECALGPICSEAEYPAAIFRIKPECSKVTSPPPPLLHQPATHFLILNSVCKYFTYLSSLQPNVSSWYNWGGGTKCSLHAENNNHQILLYKKYILRYKKRTNKTYPLHPKYRLIKTNVRTHSSRPPGELFILWPAPVTAPPKYEIWEEDKKFLPATLSPGSNITSWLHRDIWLFSIACYINFVSSETETLPWAWDQRIIHPNEV